MARTRRDGLGWLEIGFVHMILSWPLVAVCVGHIDRSDAQVCPTHCQRIEQTRGWEVHVPEHGESVRLT